MLYVVPNRLGRLSMLLLVCGCSGSATSSSVTRDPAEAVGDSSAASGGPLTPREAGQVSDAFATDAFSDAAVSASDGALGPNEDSAAQPSDAGANPPQSPHVVGTCNALPAPGTWEKISPTGTVVESKSVALDPFDSAVLWAANEHGLNKSSDCGASWTLVSTGQNGSNLAGSSLWSIAVDNVDRGTIYLVGGYGALSLWKSTNGGVDWSDLFPQGSEYATHQQYRFVNNVSMDPYNHMHLVVATHGTCSAPYGSNCDAETFDGGKTWKLSVAPSNWPEGGGVLVVDEKTWIWNDPFGGIWRTEDIGSSFTKVHTGYGGNGEFSNQLFVPASDGAYYLTSIQGVLRSADRGKSWTQVRSDGRWVGFAMSRSTLYAADQWSSTFASAAVSDPTKWTPLPAPSGLASDQGAPFLVYDEDHHLLYASTWPGGLWRMVTP